MFKKKKDYCARGSDAPPHLIALMGKQKRKKKKEIDMLQQVAVVKLYSEEKKTRLNV